MKKNKLWTGLTVGFLSVSMALAPVVSTIPVYAEGEETVTSSDENPAQIAIPDTLGTLVVGESEEVLPQFKPADRIYDEEDYQKTKILSSDPNVITVDSNGNISTISAINPGTATITAQYKNGDYVITSNPVTVNVRERKAYHFDDVPEDAWYGEALDWALQHNITSGTTPTTFSPKAPCSRAQMAVFLWNCAGSPKGNTSNFVDVAKDSWAYDAVSWLTSQGISSGTDATHFSPNAPCTRAQMATFLWKDGLKKIVTDMGAYSDANGFAARTNFSDVRTSDWYADAVNAMTIANISSGKTANTFAPKDTCTRAQMVVFLYKMNEMSKAIEFKPFALG